MIPSIDAVVNGRQVPIVLVVGFPTTGADQSRPLEMVDVGGADTTRFRAENTLAGLAGVAPFGNASKGIVVAIALLVEVGVQVYGNFYLKSEKSVKARIEFLR